MSVVDWAAIGKDIIIAIAAIITATVALRGLSGWRAETRGKARFETARDLIRASFDLRDALEEARMPMISASEYPPDYDPSSAESRANMYRHAYSNRWNPVRSAWDRFRDKAAEGEIFFGAELQGKTSALSKCAQKVRIAMDTFVENESARGSTFENDPEFGRHVRDQVSSVRRDMDNKMTKDIHDAVDAIVTQLKREVT